MRKICQSAAQDCYSMPLREFIDAYQSQVALLGIQFLWTARLQEALSKGKKVDKVQDLDKKKKDNDSIMKDLTAICLEEGLNKLQRTKVETLVTIQVYQRDKFDEIIMLVKSDKIKDEHDFDWLKNTRCYWKVEEATVGVSVTDVEFIYSYEFLGAKERLCITTLTDRCYVTLSQALGMMFGGAPAGPAGTGKTETVKDLGRTLGIFVVVTNCSDEHKFRDMAKIFKGVCQSGLWGCFDEFNRISLPTLSVVAAQVQSITDAKKQKLTSFWFPNEAAKIRLIHASAYFITMNPGYAGRQELPENLKVLFRGVTMMLPDRRTIMMVKLASVGYDKNKPLSVKFNVLYKLCEEQLSKQRHYDFGLRNILSVLRTAGNSKRAEPPSTDEEMIVARTLRDMNLSKFVAQDIPLFNSLIKDIFPKQTNIPTKSYKAYETAISAHLQTMNLVNRKDFFIKIIQLFETAQVRHGFMLVGAAGCGKSTIMNTLTEAWSGIKDQLLIKIVKMNPKAIKGQEMYGVMNNISQEWIPGIYSEIWKRANDRKNKFSTWINCDGPVDAIWIENLNTVLDDNKILTLANAERIPMSDNCKMTFEVENLDNASPATVSRCGIIYVSAPDLGWEPLFNTWCKDRSSTKEYCSPDETEWVNQFVTKYIEKPNLVIALQKGYVYMMPAPMIIRVSQFLTLLTAVLHPHIQKQEPIDKKVFELYWIYCLAWAFGGLFETDDRCKFHREILEKCNAPLPQISAARAQTEKETIFDYCVNYETKSWKQWDVPEWQAPKRLQYSQLLIPTSDSIRAEFIMDRISQLPVTRHKGRLEYYLKNTLLVGGSGTAKTSVASMFSSKFDTSVMLFKRINFSSATEPRNFQDSIEAEIERKQAKIYVPPNNKEMTVFLDDLSMPYVNAWGDQITLEIARQLIDQKGFYFLDKDARGNFKTIYNLQFLGAMNHPGGGRNDVPNRLKRQFFSINMTPPSNKSVGDIYGSVLTALFNPKKYTQDVINMKTLLIDATIAVWETVGKRLLPTPAKFHYMFTIRELARVFAGIAKVAQAHEFKVIQNVSALKEKISPQLYLIGLWRHECERTFMDKLTNNPDKKVFTDILNKTTKEKFRESLGFDDDQLMTQMIFCDFQRKDVYDEYGELVSIAPFVYEACPSLEDCRKIANEKLEGYNEKFPSKKMPLVIFDDALYHMLKISRIINTSGGNALLVGVGGSGKQSLTKLSSFTCRQTFFQVVLNKQYGDTHFKENIKELYNVAGPAGGAVTFILTDAEIKYETFLEAVNSMLSTGEIPGMFVKEDRDVIPLLQKNVYMKEAGSKGEDPSTLTLWTYFINRVKDNMHTVLCFSPVGAKFRQRAQQFPSLFSQCNIDWFLPWPEEALISVSEKFLKEFKIDNKKDVKEALIVHMGRVHQMVTEVCGIYFQQMRRHVYVTPKSYLSFINMYQMEYVKKFKGIDVEETNINNGLQKLAEATEGIDLLKIALKKEDATLKVASEQTAALLAELEVENKKADIKAAEVQQVTEACLAQKEVITAEKE
jgi:dynein heavy chain